MRKSWGIALFILVFLAVSTVAGDSDQGWPKKITDSSGREVLIQMPVQRIILQSGYYAEALKFFGETDKVIGVVDTIHARPELYPELKDKQVVGIWNAPDFELIGELAKKGDEIVPDIIVLSFTYGTSGGKSYGVDMFEKGLAPFKNITVIGLDLTNPENITESMTKLGIILGKEKEAEAYNMWHNAKIAQIEASVKGLPMQKYYLEGGSSTGTGELTAYAPESATSKLLRMIGGYNILKDSDMHMASSSTAMITWEWVITQNPDAILKLMSSTNLGWEGEPSSDTLALEKTRNEVLGRPGAEKITATKKGNVFLINSQVLYGLFDVVGLASVAKLFHPEADIDPEEIWNEYQKLIGHDYPQDRTFIYPDLKAA